MPATTIHYMKLAFLVENGSVIAGDEGVCQNQVAILQPADGERGVGNVYLFLAGFIDKHQSCSWNGFGHKAIAPEVGYACRDHRTDVKKSTTCIYGRRASPRDPPEPQIVVFVRVTLDFHWHPSVQEKAQPCAMYIQGRGEEKSCECPLHHPPTTKAMPAPSPPCSYGTSRTS